MDPRRAYRVLGVPPESPAEEVKRAYRDLAQVWHPDRFPADSRLAKKAENNLKRINEAYDALRDYQPATGPARPASLRESIAAVLDLGDLRDSMDDLRASVAGRAPAGLRHSLKVLGLGPIRRGEHRVREQHGDRVFRLVVIGALLVVIAMALTVIL